LRSRLCRLICVLAVLVIVLPLAAQDRAAGLKTAFLRARHLQHGINASMWFAQSTGNYSAARTNRYIDAADIALMARLGFDNVRLSIDPAPLDQYPHGADGFNDEFLGRIDRAVDGMIANGLAVQIDVHPEDGYKQQLRSSDDAVDRFVMLWRRLAAHFAVRNPDMVFFEILNEPEVNDRYRWAGIQQRVAAAIRESAPQNTIIATGANYSDISELLVLQPLADGNVIYNFHYYEPHEFTHQGAGWGVPWWSYTHGIPYPPTDSSMQAALAQVPDPGYRFTLENYWLDHWDARRIRLQVDAAAAWAHQYNVPLIVNEFGAYRETTDPVSRANWIRDARTAFEADGIGWTMWDYRGSFGVVTKQDGQPAQVDAATLAALGLHER